MVKQHYGSNARLQTRAASRMKVKPNLPAESLKYSHEHNVRSVKEYIERRWARGIPRDFTSPDFWGDRLK